MIFYSELLNIDGVLLFVEFKKALDTIKWNMMFYVLTKFGFKRNFVKLVKALYNDIVTGISKEQFLEYRKNVLTETDKLKQAEKWHETNEYDAEIFCPLGFCYGYFQLFNIESEQIQSSDKDNIYPDSGHIGEHDVWFRNKWGTIIDTNNDPGLFKIFGNLKELPFKVGHLGHSSVNNPLNKDFFN